MSAFWALFSFNTEKGASKFSIIVLTNPYLLCGNLSSVFQTSQEFQVLQGAMIDAQLAKRGKTVASRKLRNSAKKFDGMVIDYRQMGYVTEVKDQVRLGPKVASNVGPIL